MGSFRRLGPFVDGAGLRLLAPNRRNFGQGIADPRTREAPELFARDVAEMLDHLGLDQVVLCGHLAGSLHAFACASHLGARCAGLVTVSGNVPILSMAQVSTMSPRQRAVAYTARFAPVLLPAIINAAIALIDGKSASDFARSLYLAGTPDAALVEDPDIADALIEGYRYTVAQGSRGFQSDAWHVTQDWSRFVEGVRCPVLLIHGAKDRVVSPDSVADFAARHPSFVLETIPDAGQLLLYGRSQILCDRIAGFARRCLHHKGILHA
jgi:pimeloyl-ACP methyl ester carboxylesterase